MFFIPLHVQNLPSFDLGVSGNGLLVGTISRLKLLTRSRSDNAGDGGGFGRSGKGCKLQNHVKHIVKWAQYARLPFILTGANSLRIGNGVSEDFLFRRGGATGNETSPFGGSGGFIFDCNTITCKSKDIFKKSSFFR